MSLGPVCPKCGSHGSSVTNSRVRAKADKLPSAYVRRRICATCGERFTTIEITQAYLSTLEDGGKVIIELKKAKTLLSAAIDALANVQGGTLL
jgi:transcriptional regulator NrdR family protein